MPKYDLLTKQNYIFSGGLIQIDPLTFCSFCCADAVVTQAIHADESNPLGHGGRDIKRKK